MKRLAVAVAAALLLTACGGGEPDAAACEEAMRGQFAEALASGAEGERPEECEGVSDAELERMAEDIIGDAFES